MSNNNDYPRLCGGTFLTLILQARPQRTGSRQRCEGGTDGLNDADVLVGLMRVIDNNYKDVKESSLKSFVSSYKSCTNSHSSYLPFSDELIISAFDKKVRENYDSVLDSMKEFVSNFIDLDEAVGKYRLLVRALIDLIVNDHTIPNDASFYIQYNHVVKKKELCNIESLDLSSFLLGVWHFIVTNVKDNRVGKSTYDILCPQGKVRNSKRVYKGTLGCNKYENINIIVSERDSRVAENYVPNSLIDEKTVNLKNKTVPSDVNVFSVYVASALRHYSIKKTLINPETPCDFYDIYVCNDLSFGHRGPANRVLNSTINDLSSISRYLIIQGIGGAGKSMFITHLFLDAAKHLERKILPVLVFLKDYCEDNTDILDFAYKSIVPFDSSIKKENLIECLNNKQVALLLDGLDEIRTSLRSVFEQKLESFIKSYEGNSIIITSRPILSFASYVSYKHFSVSRIEPLTKKQSIELIKKIQFWDKNSKERFIKDLDCSLYKSHQEFASNPLLLSIMLMTYSSFGEIPNKRHIFYSKAYETMSRLHDATKGGFIRTMHTQLSPEVFAKYFAEFCARTYADEKFSFDLELFSRYIDEVIKRRGSIEQQIENCNSHNFLLDLTDNLCLMYKDGYQYYFIHRSFQEYFMALYFSLVDDSKLNKLVAFFEKRTSCSSSELSFGMLYDLIPERVEKHIFLPFLEKTISKFESSSIDAYWAFLSHFYPIIYVNAGEVGDGRSYNEPSSFLYQKIIEIKNITCILETDFTWPDELIYSDLYSIDWVYAYSYFATKSNFIRNYEEKEGCFLEEPSYDMVLVMKDELPREYIELFGDPQIEGSSFEIDVDELYRYKDLENYREIVDFMNSDEFPLKKEFNNLIRYYKALKKRISEQEESDSLFDD